MSASAVTRRSTTHDGNETDHRRSDTRGSNATTLAASSRRV
jgi:hypothetical protein